MSISFERLKLSSIAFTLKFAIAPGVAVALMGVLAYFGSGALNQQVEQAQIIVERNLEGSIRLSDIAARVQAANGELFRIMTHQAAGDGTDIAGGITGLQGRLDGIIGDLASYREGYAQAEHAAQLEAIEAELQKYKEATAFVAAMLEIDFASVVSFMQPFEENFAKFSEQIGTIVAATASDSQAIATASQAEAETASAIFFGLTVAAALVVALLAWLVGHSTSRSIRRIADATLRLAANDTDVEVTALARRDELGAIVQSLTVFRDNAVKMQELQANEARLREEAEAEKQRAMAEIADNFEASVRQVVQSVTEASAGLKTRAVSMRETVEGASRQSSEVAQAGEAASTNVATVATASEELSASIGEISRQVEDAVAVANDAVERASSTDRTIGELAEVALRIGDIVSLIQDIAGQTNLLALNATIEAARAGEYGKGFAVVASEVKNLASQTGKATEEISGQIEAIQSRTRESVEAIRGISETIARMNGIASGIAAAVNQQSASTQEISRNVQQASAATGAVSKTIAEVRDASHTVGVTATDVLSAAEDLTAQSGALESEVNAFLSRIRA